MTAINIVILVTVTLVVISILGVYIYKKLTGKPTGDCSTCSSNGHGLVDQYHRAYKKKSSKHRKKD